MPNIIKQQIVDSKKSARDFERQAKNYMSENEDFKASAMDWAISASRGLTDMTKALTILQVAYKLSGGVMSKADSERLDDYKNYLKETFGINDIQIDMFNDLFNMNVDKLADVEGITEDGKTVFPKKEEEEPKKEEQKKPKKFESEDLDEEEPEIKTEQELQQEELDNSLRESAKEILKNEKKVELENSLFEYNNMDERERNKYGVILDTKVLDSIKERNKFFFTESNNKDYDESIYSQVKNVFENPKYSKYVRSDVGQQAKVIGGYFALKDTIASRSFISKLFHPIRTYQESSLLGQVKGFINNKLKINDDMLKSVAEVIKNKNTNNVLNINKDGKVLRDGEPTEAEIDAKFNELKQQTKQIESNEKKNELNVGDKVINNQIDLNKMLENDTGEKIKGNLSQTQKINNAPTKEKAIE